MKLLFVNPGGDAAGGAERSLALLIRGLALRGHEIGVITLLPGDAGETFAQAGATVLANGVGRGLGGVNRHGSTGRMVMGVARTVPDVLTTARTVRDEAEAVGAHIVHTNGLRAHVLAPLIGAKAPVIWSLRERPPGTLAKRLLRATVRGSAAVVAPTEFAARMVVGCRTPVHVIPNAVQRPDRIERDSARRAHGIPLDRPVVSVVAHLHPTKGHHVAVAAWQHLAPPRPILVLVGGDLYGRTSTDYRERLVEQITTLGLDGDVVMTGTIREVAAIYSASDIILHPALYPEGFGRSLAEAQLSGVPVIATALGGALELIEDRRSGLLVAPDDPLVIAEAVTRLLSDTALGDRLREGGLAAATRFDPDAHAAAVEAVYRAAVA